MTAIPSHRKASLHVAEESTIRLISLDQIRVLNPRIRNRQIFAKLVENIAAIGLKRPITVTPTADDQGECFEIVCGQGRFEAFQALGESKIPCIVVSASEADRFLISLVENLARRKHSNRDLLYSIQVLSDRGYSGREIANKTCLDVGYINGILMLLRNGEERLIAAVEKGWLPIKVATEIARANDNEIQQAMIEAYETGVLKGDQLIRVRRLIDRRKALGKRYGQQLNSERLTTPQKLLNAYQAEVRRQKVMIKKADINEQRLLIIITALRKLLADDYFCTLLRTEEIQDMPKPLADRIQGEMS
ncbi:plasmid partitioning protein RepB C-terminal domain-containing protein [Pseudomonas resinovorans]|uniref:ParB/RepB/Spo0J family partition protein n=1 Tax=Metapseudomonas resinovorans TaxID=53412 RepID=UPI00237F69F6|nr:plasmid partitioning protein RepB C-terminal domain-containing protein [Pseudomonas resinovorans]MDE3739386.1 plasmid partitioning protein RepB C-terminal domain-containing protein [Pseudomonas resinovorans]